LLKASRGSQKPTLRHSAVGVKTQPSENSRVQAPVLGATQRSENGHVQAGLPSSHLAM